MRDAMQQTLISWGRRLTLVAVLALTACLPRRAPNCRAAPPEAGCARVLFLGNSYTFVNNLPGVFEKVAASLGHPVYTDLVAPGGARLADHSVSDDVRQRIRTGHWTHVVLQEQSLFPAVEASRQREMYPAVRALVAEIRAANAQPVLLATWGRPHGYPEGGFADYATMQAEITRGYRTIAQEQQSVLVPVGDAWAAVTAAHPDIPLWQPDGSHPSVQGTFLAANVLAATLFRAVPRGLGTRGDVPEVHVYRLQQAAAKAALGAAAVP